MEWYSSKNHWFIVEHNNIRLPHWILLWFISLAFMQTWQTPEKSKLALVNWQACCYWLLGNQCHVNWHLWGFLLPLLSLLSRLFMAKENLWEQGTWCKLWLPNWLYGLFVRMLISLMNAYTSCGRSTLNFIERFWLGSVRSAFKLNSKCSQMNYEMNYITMHKCTEMYSKWPIHWWVPILLL